MAENQQELRQAQGSSSLIWLQFDGPRARTVGVLTTPRLIPQMPIVAHRLVGMHLMHTVRRKFWLLNQRNKFRYSSHLFPGCFFALFVESPFQTQGLGGDRAGSQGHIRLEGNVCWPPLQGAGGWQNFATVAMQGIWRRRSPQFPPRGHFFGNGTPGGGKARVNTLPCSNGSLLAVCNVSGPLKTCLQKLLLGDSPSSTHRCYWAAGWPSSDSDWGWERTRGRPRCRWAGRVPQK